MKKLITLGAAGLLTSVLFATGAQVAFADGDGSSSVVRTADDRGRDHADDGPRHGGRHEGCDDRGRHHGHHRGHHHGHDDHGHHGDDDRR